MIWNEYMEDLFNDLIESGRSESTAKKYVSDLYVLNDKECFDDICFLRDSEGLNNKLCDYKLSTKSSMCGSILAVLKLRMPNSSSINRWTKILEHYKGELEDCPKNVKTDKQKENWKSWSDIEKLRSDYRVKAESSTASYEDVLNYFVLCLYTCVPPRRNLDYLEMYIVPHWNEGMDDSKNYLAVRDRMMVFNVYKTSKTMGRQTLDYSGIAELEYGLRLYLNKYRGVDGENHLLLTKDGNGFHNSTSMTRLLNRLLGGKIGASMLRHMYLSHKYGDTLNDMCEDASAMAHSTSQQKEYIVY